MEEEINPILQSQIELLKQEAVYLLVDRARVAKLPSTLQGQCANATSDLLMVLEMRVTDRLGDVYVLTNEEYLLSALEAFRKEHKQPRLKFASIKVSSVLFLQHLARDRPETMVVDFGQESSQTFKKSEIQQLPALALCVTLSRLKSIFVLQDSSGYPLQVEIEGGRYAIGFLSKKDGKTTADGFRDEVPKCRLESNRPIDVAEGIAESEEFDGLVLNPASENQKILEADELKQLAQVCQMVDTGGTLQKLFKRLK